MLSRLLERGKTSGRADDNKESIVKRFRECYSDSVPDAPLSPRSPVPPVTSFQPKLTPGTFVETSMPVVDYYREQDRVVDIDSSPSVDEVYANVRLAVEDRLSRASGATSTAAAPAATAELAPAIA